MADDYIGWLLANCTAQPIKDDADLYDRMVDLISEGHITSVRVDASAGKPVPVRAEHGVLGYQPADLRTMDDDDPRTR